MRSMKAMLLVAVAALAVTAFAAPSLASASEWKKEGKALEEWAQWSTAGVPLEAEPSVTVAGTTKFNAAVTGSVECTSNETFALIPGESVARISSATFSGCAVGGVLKAEKCSVSSATANKLPWYGVVTPNGEFLSNFDVTYNIGGSAAYCKSHSTITVTNTLVERTVDNKDAVSSLTLSGAAKANPGNLTVAMSGTQSLSPAGKYGVFSGPVVKLQGGLSLSNLSTGTLSCSGVTGYLVLESGGKGRVTSLKGMCQGAYSRFCQSGANTLSMAAKAPWSVTNEGTFVRVPAAALTIQQPKTAGCPEALYEATGELSLTPSEASVSAISETGISGAMKETGGFPWSTGGTLSWTPSGAYGLK